MLQTAHSLIARAGHALGLDAPTIASLTATNAEHSFDIELSGGRSYRAYRVQHNNSRGPYKGGIRFHPEVNLEEVRALATLMSFKTAAVGLPLGGGKGGVAVDPRSLSASDLEELSRAYVRHLAPHIGPHQDVPAPDVNTNATIMDWMVDEYATLTGDTSRAAFTGKSLDAGGSLGRDAATGRGGVISLREYLKLKGRLGHPLTYAIQGFGNVGSFFSTIAALEHPEWRLVAASDSAAGVSSAQGLKAGDLSRYKAGRGRFADYHAHGVKLITNDDLLQLDVDVLILAGLGDAITPRNAAKVKARYLVELANGPVDDEAATSLNDRGHTIIPDIVANAGGVIVSYLEWQQNLAGEHWDEAHINRELERYLVAAVQAMTTMASTYHVPLKEAAFMVAINRLRETKEASTEALE